MLGNEFTEDETHCSDLPMYGRASMEPESEYALLLAECCNVTQKRVSLSVSIKDGTRQCGGDY